MIILYVGRILDCLQLSIERLDLQLNRVDVQDVLSWVIVIEATGNVLLDMLKLYTAYEYLG